MKKLLKNGLCVLLCVLMVITVIPAQVLAATGKEAASDEDGKPAAITNASGEETEVADEWEQAYPYGVFAFSNYTATGTEDGEEITVPVYRLGGTKGRVTAYVIYNPAVTQLDENRLGYANALSTDDVEIAVQDTSPIAQYQPIGKDPDPEKGNYTVNRRIQDGEYTFTLSSDADSYQWQTKGDRDWEDAFGETEKSITVTQEEYNTFDFRCVYKKGDTAYCTTSAGGEKYEKPEPEVLPEMPEEIDLGHASTYTKLEPDEDDAYKGYAFPITFADGEWLKNIRFTPKQDELSECPESAALIIQECDGGCINKSFNSTTVTVEDDDPAEPFEIGLTETKIKADKAEGSVKLTVKRTGGYQEPVTVDYETVDGTALAGRDYIAASDTMAFAGDVDEITLELQLLDDGIKTDVEKDFTLRLKNLDGDIDDICTLTDTEVTVSLINSGSAKRTNLATKLTDTDAIDLASSDDLSEEGVVDTAPDTVTGQQVKEPEPLCAEIKRGKTIQGMLKTYRYGDTLSFTPTSGESYWSDSYRPLKEGLWLVPLEPDYTGCWSDSEDKRNDSQNVWSYYGNTSAELTVPYMIQMYKSVTFSEYTVDGYLHGDSASHAVRAFCGVSVNGTSLGEWYSDTHIGGTYPDGTVWNEWYSNSTNTVDFAGVTDYSDKNNKVYGRFEGGCGDDPTVIQPALVSVSNLSFTRRTYSKPLGIAVQTANDEDTAPEHAAVTNTDLYNTIKPTVSLVPSKSGVGADTNGDGSGDLYVGSTLRIDFADVVGYSALNKKDNSAAVYLTDSDGNVLTNAVKGDDGKYYLTLQWENMTLDDVNRELTVNVVINRDQNLTLDFTHSVQRMDDGETPDVKNHAKDTFNNFWKSIDKTVTNEDQSYIEYGYTEEGSKAPYFESKEPTVAKIMKADTQCQTSGNTAFFSPAAEDNIQWVNFHRSENDFIVINGRTYAGNAQIWLTTQDFSSQSLRFYYYSEKYATVASKMVATIDHIELYRDTNRNFKIDGKSDSNGYFHLDKDTTDTMIMRINGDDTFTEKDLDWLKVGEKENDYAQLYFKVYYTMNPRKLKATAEEEKHRAQVMPALVTDITDPARVFALSQEQKNYRYLISGKYSDEKHQYPGEDGKEGDYYYTSDEHPMYGGDATALQYIDGPLGGDQSPAVCNTDDNGTAYYTWKPQYVGNLLYPYDDPSPIYIENTVVGENYALTDKDNINGYLGSLTENTRMALCVFQQKRSVGEILKSQSNQNKKGGAKDEDPDDPDNPDNEHDFDGGDSSTPVDPVPQPDPKAWADGVSGDAYDYKQDSYLASGVNLDYNTKVPTMTFGAFGAVNVITNFSDVILSINIPFGNFYADELETEDDPGMGYHNDTVKRFKAFASLFTKKGMGKLVDALTDRSVQNLRNPMSPGLGFLSFKAFATVGFAWEWKYDTIKKERVFQQFTWAVSIGVEGSVTYRPWGLVYICISGGLTASLGTGKYRNEHYVYSKMFPGDNDSASELKAGEYFIDPKTNKDYIELTYQELNIGFKGKINLELFSDKECTKLVKNASRGYLVSASEQEMLVPLTHNSGYTFENNQTYYLKIKALDDSKISSIEAVTEKKVEYFNEDVNISVSPFMNITGGVGGGCLKFELTFHVGYTMNFSAREGTDKDVKELNTGTLSFTVSMTLQLILFSYSCDIINVSLVYDYNQKKWTKASRHVIGAGQVKSVATKRGGKTDYGSLFDLPEDTSDTQTIYRPQDQKSGSGGGLKAYQPTDKSVPFELSGFYTSSNAARLLDGVNFGYDYRVIPVEKTVGGKTEDVNYVLYHISRDKADNTMDQSLLVLSELVMTGSQNGLVNPADPKSNTPYIVVDVDKDGNPDSTGDLDFSVDCVDTDNGKELRVAWVSYGKTAKADTGMSTKTITEAAQNTVIKTAAYTPGAAAFSAAETVSSKEDPNASGDKGECVQIPDITEDAEVFVRSNHLKEQELSDRTARYESYLRTAGYCVDEPDQTNDDEVASHSTALSLIASKTASWTTAGKSSDLCVRIGGSAVSSIQMDDGITVDSAKIEKIGGKYYVAYSTVEDCYTDGSGGILTDNSDPGNLLTIKRMYLRTCSLDDSGSVVWGMDGKAILLRTLYDYDTNTEHLVDGIFVNGTISRKDNPYFDNIQFLNANLGNSLSGTDETLPLKSSAAEDFLLFDMCGSTYIIRQDSLEQMTGDKIKTDDTGTTTTAQIIPFFTPDAASTDNNGASASSGRVDTTIGVDGDGNLAAVYTAGMPNTNNTALCISKYQPDVGWGDKTVLAMNYLTVQEENTKYHRSDADASQAFYGLLQDGDTGPDSGVTQGGLNEFRFKNPQIALGKESTVVNGTVTQKPTLMILTQGSMQYLKENTDPKTKDLTPLIPADADEVRSNPTQYPRSDEVPPGSGIYAIEFGSGTQAIGNMSFSMTIEDFSTDATPEVIVGFENTGDVPIRGSSTQPITVEVKTSFDEAASLGKWVITDNVIPGQQVSLTGKLHIKKTLPVGTKIYLTVSEDNSYQSQGGTPFYASSDDLLVIEEHPELAVRTYQDDCIAEFESVHEDGDSLIDLSFIADNRGTADAKNVRAIFSYDTGSVDENGNKIYAPLDLTESEITIDETAEPTQTQGDKKNGELIIGDIAVDYSEHIFGKLKVSPDCFSEKSTESLALRIELFSDADKSLPEDAPDGTHNEYNSANNIYTGPVKHHTIFTAPVNIEVPIGEMLHIPIRCTYTTGDGTPHILVAEFPGLDGQTHFSVHAFRYGEFDNGSGSGLLEIKAESEGTGYLRVKDINTNSFFDIAYTVTPAADGINVYYEKNGIFSFKNADGSDFNPDGGSNQSWDFPDNIQSWGADNTAPYMNDLSRGLAVGEDDPNKSSFYFDTDAESIDIIFRGTIRVDSTFPGFEPVTVSAEGGDGKEGNEYATVVFGNNPKELPHTVTVTVLDGDDTEPDSPFTFASFDRIIEYYNQYELPIPDDDESAPQLFFGQSFPDSGSIASKTADGNKNHVTITAYLFDETGIASVSVNGRVTTDTEKDDVKFWTSSITFSQNGLYTITTIDDLGNMADYKLNVDWFSGTAESETYSLPSVAATLMKHVEGGDDVELTDDTVFTDDDLAYIRAAGAAAQGSDAPTFSATEVTVTQKEGLVSFNAKADEDGTFPTRSSGWYIIKAYEPGSNGKCWSATVVEMMHLTKRQLVITVDPKHKNEGEADPALTYQTSGLWSGDELTGSLTRDASEEAGDHAITQGTLSASDLYHIVYRGANLTIRHNYGDPAWSWESVDYETVAFDIRNSNPNAIRVVEIHPDYYTVNGGDPIYKSSDKTKYVLTGNVTESYNDFHMIIHSEETEPAAYFIGISGLVMNEPSVTDCLFCVNGSNAEINLSLQNENVIWVGDYYNGYVFKKGELATTTTPVNIWKADDASTSFYGPVSKRFTTDGFAFNKVGDYDITYCPYSGTGTPAENFGTVMTADYDYLMLSGSSNIDEPSSYRAAATFTCTTCGTAETVYDYTPQPVAVPATCTERGYTGYQGTVTMFDSTYTDVYKVTQTDPLSHSWGEPVWEWDDPVNITLNENSRISIHPDYYTVDGGDPIYKDCAKTKYVITGFINNTNEPDCHIILHDGETDEAAYNLFFNNLSVRPTIGDFVTVNGSNATINLTLCKSNGVWAQGYVFGSGDAAAQTTLNITKGDEESSYFNAGGYSLIPQSFASDLYTVNKTGDYDILYYNNADNTSRSASDFSDFTTGNYTGVRLSGGTGSADPAAPIAAATFTCPVCGTVHTESDPAPVREEGPEQCENITRYLATVNFNGKTYTDEKVDGCFCKHSLSLNGSIGVNFYLYVTDKQLTDGAVVDFTWTVNDVEKTHSVTLTADDKTSCGYKATCPIAVAEMTYDITAALSVKGEQLATDTYSAKQYADVILSDENGFKDKYVAKENEAGRDGETRYGQLITLVQTMLDYGAKAQVKFDRNTDQLANGGTDFFTDEVSFTSGADDMSEYLSDCGLTYVGSSVVYLSETTLRHYYKIVEPDKFTDEIKNGITFDGTPVTYGSRNGMIYFDKTDIAASQLDTAYALSINGHDYHYAALDYSALAYSLDTSSYGDSIQKQLAASVYRYNQAANAYFSE